MAQIAKLREYAALSDPEWLNQLISDDIRTRLIGHCGYVDWHQDAYWPALVRAADFWIEWDGMHATAYLPGTRRNVTGKDIGDVVCRAYARLHGLIR